MTSENKNQTTHYQATFSVAKEAVCSNLKTGSPNFKDSTAEQTILNTSDSIAGITPASIKKIEAKLKLTFLSEKDQESKVCMANNLEVRDDFKDIFDLKDLLDYSYAVLNLSNYLEKYRDLSKTDCFQVSYPIDSNHFWKLANLGAQLRNLNILEGPSTEKHNDDIDEILKKIAEIKVE